VSNPPALLFWLLALPPSANFSLRSPRRDLLVRHVGDERKEEPPEGSESVRDLAKRASMVPARLDVKAQKKALRTGAPSWIVPVGALVHPPDAAFLYPTLLKKSAQPLGPPWLAIYPSAGSSGFRRRPLAKEQLASIGR
jgi:hypothetical protein